MAVFGHRAGARAVGQVAARDDRFLNAHRVIRQGGRIPEGWGGGGDGPLRCRLRLEAEGVRFQTGVADPGCLVHWMTIVDRIASRSPETAPPVTPPAVK